LTDFPYDLYILELYILRTEFILNYLPGISCKNVILPYQDRWESDCVVDEYHSSWKFAICSWR